MAVERNYTLPAAWAENALTTIPPTPVTGQSYRKEPTDVASIQEGSIFNELADSSEWNQFAYLVGLLAREVDRRGIAGWSDATDYDLVPAYVRGSDGEIYRSTVATGPSTTVVDPVGDLTGTWITSFNTFSPGTLKGNVLSNYTTTTIDVGAGKALDEGSESVNIIGSGQAGLDITAAWVEGGPGGRATGGTAPALGPNQTWFVFKIGKPNGVSAYGYDTELNASNLLANAASDGYTVYRRIGWVLTDAINDIIPGIWDGDRFTYQLPIVEFTETLNGGVDTPRVLARVPTGLKFKVGCKAQGSRTSTTAVGVRYRDPNNPDLTSTEGVSQLIIDSDGSALNMAANFEIFSDNASTINYRSDGTISAHNLTVMYIEDRRGKD